MTKINTEEHTILQKADHDAFFSAIDNPPAPTELALDAFRRSLIRYGHTYAMLAASKKADERSD